MRVTRKGYSDDKLLQYSTLQSPLFQATRDKLTEAGITRYSKLLEVVSDENAETDIRATAISIVGIVLEALDKRYILKPVFKVLGSPNEDIRIAVIRTLSRFNYPEVVNLLVNLACDKQESFGIRLWAVQGLTSNKNIECFNQLKDIILRD